jgi:hypothetical protein
MDGGPVRTVGSQDEQQIITHNLQEYINTLGEPDLNLRLIDGKMYHGRISATPVYLHPVYEEIRVHKRFLHDHLPAHDNTTLKHPGGFILTIDGKLNPALKGFVARCYGLNFLGGTSFSSVPPDLDGLQGISKIKYMRYLVDLMLVAKQNSAVDETSDVDSHFIHLLVSMFPDDGYPSELDQVLRYVHKHYYSGLHSLCIALQIMVLDNIERFNVNLGAWQGLHIHPRLKDLLLTFSPDLEWRSKVAEGQELEALTEDDEDMLADLPPRERIDIAHTLLHIRTVRTVLVQRGNEIGRPVSFSQDAWRSLERKGAIVRSILEKHREGTPTEQADLKHEELDGANGLKERDPDMLKKVKEEELEVEEDDHQVGLQGYKQEDPVQEVDIKQEDPDG